MPVTVVTACYGDRHRAFLGAMLESLAESAARSPVVVVHDGIDWLERYAPQVVALASDDDFGATREVRVARRQAAWCRGLDAVADGVADGVAVAFLDADTLVEHPLGNAFEAAFDVAYTTRPGPSPWPINCGVVFARAGDRARLFFRCWREVTEVILRDSFLRAHARSRWGAVDQAAFVMTRELLSGKEPLSFHALPGAAWNSTACVPDRAVYVRHLKGLLPYLLGEKAFAPGDEHYGHDQEPLGDHAALFGRWRELHERHRKRIGDRGRR